MAEKTAIAWCDSTFNPWIGCTKVGPGCDFCYAEAADQRFHGGIHWGVGAPRHRTSEGYWRQPLSWEKNWQKFHDEHGHNRRVFCASQADVFDNEVVPQWRADLWDLIRATPHLDWLLVTKRRSNIPKMLPSNWGPNGYQNVWLIITVVNQEEVDRDVPHFQQIPAVVHGLSIEPQLGEITLDESMVTGNPLHRINWAIYGGESRQGKNCRLYNIDWPRAGVLHGRHHGYAVFVKQLGSLPALADGTLIEASHIPEHARFSYKWDEPEHWPAILRVRQFPKAP